MSSDYRLSPALAARLVGLLTVGVALLVFAATAASALLEWPPLVLLPVAIAALATIVGVGTHLRRVPAVRLDGDGYRVRLVRGAGVRQARWRDVAEVATTTRDGTSCVLVRLEDGRTTTIPAGVLAADREEFVRDLAGHLPGGRAAGAERAP